MMLLPIICKRKFLHCLVVTLLFALPIKSGAQGTLVDSVLSEYLGAGEKQRIAHDFVQKIAVKNGVEVIDFDGRYSSRRTLLDHAIDPYLEVELSRFIKRNKLHRQPSNQSLSTTLTNELKHFVEVAVADALRKNNALASLVRPNYNDRILNFHSDIQVKENGKILVEETITVYNGDGSTGDGYDPATMSSPNDDIKRGIVRDFPTRYTNAQGLSVKVGFKLLQVLHNGAAEPYITQQLDNGKRIMVGRKEVFIEKGIHTYQLQYETDRQLIFHDDKDELYWNVNGNGWVFSIDSISCKITFPVSAHIKEYDCYTGFTGSTDRACVPVKLNEHSIWFTGITNFEPYQGLTVAAAIEKGVLHTPGQWETIGQTMKDNFMLPVMALFVIGMFIFYFNAWRKVGKDPKKGSVYPQLEPPAGISAAGAGFILNQGYEPRQFAAALVDCAVHNQLKIDVKKEGWLIKSTVYEFSKPENAARQPDGFNSNYAYGLTPESFYHLKVQAGKYDPFVASAAKSLEARLKGKFEITGKNKNTLQGLFRKNKGFTRGGIALLVVAAFAAFVYVVSQQQFAILLWIGGLWLLALIVHIIFASIMPSYTDRGRAVADQLEGFKMYLGTAEKQLYEYFTPPEKSLDLFEKYLPYAIALGVENAWASKFEDMLSKALTEGYQPNYYGGSGMGSSFRAADFGHVLSSGLSSTIAAASTPPSSSSGGSSGGGSSGGGGGGGGGGGW